MKFHLELYFKIMRSVLSIKNVGFRIQFSL